MEEGLNMSLRCHSDLSLGIQFDLKGKKNKILKTCVPHRRLTPSEHKIIKITASIYTSLTIRQTLF